MGKRSSTTATIASLLLTGCTIAPHGSHTTHRVWTYDGRKDGLVRYEKWTDRSAGGGMSLGTDLPFNNAHIEHTNSALQVGGALTIGNAAVVVSTNTAGIVTAVGDAAGKVIGQALSTAATGKP